MALIGKIRKHSWVLIVLIGLGLASFILMDMFAGDKSAFGSSQNIMGSFGDKKLDYTEFSKTEQALYGNSSGDVFTRRNVLWNYFVEEALVKKQADALGLGVCRDELMDLQFGANPSPIITQRFMDPNTRQIDRAQLNNIKQTLEAGNLQDAIDKGQLNPSFPGFWAHQEKEIIKDRLQSKLSTMVSKAMYTPTWMVEQAHADQNQRVEFEYVQIPFDEVDDSDVSLTDADYTNYLNSNKGKFVTDEETRKLAYFSFDVIPTLGDSAKIKEGLVELKTAFAETTDDSIFVENNYGTMDPAYLSKDKVSAAIAETVFDLPAGSVYGPYIDNGNYQLVKVIDNMTVADSVKSRHILIKATNQTELVAGNNTIDSLKALIEAGTNDFADLAKQFSQGPSASKGGDLGYAAPGAMVKPFNDLIYFTAEVGNVYKVFTQFGVHLVEVQDRKYINNNQGVQLAYIAQPIVPSQKTDQLT